MTGGERFTEEALAEGDFVSPARFADGNHSGRPATEAILGPVLLAMPFDGAPYGGCRDSGGGQDEDLAEPGSFTPVKPVDIRFRA